MNKLKNKIYKIIYKKDFFALLLFYFVIVAFVSAAQYFFVIDFTAFKNGEVIFNSIKLLQGDESILPESESGYSFKLRDVEKKVISQKTFNFDFKTEVDSSRGYMPIDIDRIDGFIRFPYSENAQTLEVADKNGKVLTQVYLKDFICKKDGLCPLVCRETNDDDCLGQGKCGDGICQTRYENEKTCPSDCLQEKPLVIPTTTQEPEIPKLPKKGPANFLIFVITFLIVVSGAYIYFKKRKKAQTS